MFQLAKVETKCDSNTVKEINQQIVTADFYTYREQQHVYKENMLYDYIYNI